MLRQAGIATAMLAAIIASTAARAGDCTEDVCVRISPSSLIVADSFMFSVDIVADINTPILGWGLDISISNPSAVNGLISQTLGSSFFPVTTLDGDGLAGIAFPNGVSGNNVHLATLTFSTDQPGVSTLDLHVTPGDLTEGFPLDPSGFASYSLASSEITVVFVPEPATAALMLCAAAAAIRSRRRASV